MRVTILGSTDAASRQIESESQNRVSDPTYSPRFRSEHTTVFAFDEGHFPAMTSQIEATIRMAGAQPSGISRLSWQLSRKANASPEGKFQLLTVYHMEGEL